MLYRCANSPFDYCKGKPDWLVEPMKKDEEDENSPIIAGVCKFDYKTCQFRQTMEEHDRELYTRKGLNYDEAVKPKKKVEEGEVRESIPKDIVKKVKSEQAKMF